MGRVAFVVLLLAAATGLGLWWRSRNGRYTPVSAALLDEAHVEDRDDLAGARVDAADRGLTSADLGAPLGAHATFAQFSSEVCAPCRRTAVVLSELAHEHAGVAHVELDVAEHLDLVRRLHILRTPTVLLLDPAGAVVGRASGAMSRHQAHAALAALDRTPRSGP